MYIVYQARHRELNRVYIGVTSAKLDARIAQHYRIREEKRDNFQHYLHATRAEDWDWVIIGEFVDKKEAFGFEAQEIKRLDKTIALNIQKRRWAVKDNVSSCFKKGMVPWIKGRTHTEETREKMRESKLYKPTRVDWTDTQKEHLRLAQSNRKEILCIELDRVFDSLSQMAVELGICKANIRKVLNGERKSTSGYTFKLIEKGI